MRTTFGLLVTVVAVLSMGCQERGTTAGAKPTAAQADLTTTTADSGVPAGGDQTREEACVDAWLARNKLDAYGSAEGTMYAGGSPLFDERTGETKNRLDFVYAQRPEAKRACGAGGP